MEHRDTQIYEAPAGPRPLTAVVSALGTVLFFFSVCLSSASTIKPMALIVAIASILLVLLRYRTLSKRVSGPLFLLAAVLLLAGISTLYSVAGKFALYEFLKLLSAFCWALILLSVAPGERGESGRWIAGILAGFSALSGLVSIDLLSTRLFSGPVLALLERLTPDYTVVTGVEPGVRMTSIFINPNVFAGMVGLGVLLSLGLARAARSRGERGCFTILLYLNSLSFLLAFSMGGTAAIAVAFLVFLALERRGERLRLFVLMGETLVVSVMSAAVISATSLQSWDGIQPIPILCAALGAGALCLADRFVGQPLALWLSGREKLLALLAGLSVAAAAIFGLVALRHTGPAFLWPGEDLRRAADLSPGVYTLEVESDGEAALQVTIESQNRQETMMHTGVILYQGTARRASFTVPEDSLVVYFTFSTPEDCAIQSAIYTGNGGVGEIPLDYTLLPGFIANRLQGLWANENAIQRLVFFSDGLKLFRRSPIIGLGLGGYENSIKSVQSFFYETKYAHNHYIQTMVETGVVGLLLFLLLLGGSAAALLRHRKLGDEAHPLTPALGAALVFMAGHGAVEVVFSAYPYLPMAFGVFALISLCCVCPPKGTRVKPRETRPALLVVCALIAVYAVLLGCNMRARSVAASQNNMAGMEKGARLDRFEWADYALSYVERSISFKVDEPTRQRADQYAERLAALSSNIIPLRLTNYYFETGRAEQAFAMAEQYVSYVPSDSNSWNRAFAIIAQYEQDAEVYRSGVLRIAALMEDWNAANMGEITLDERAQTLIARMGGA